MLKISFLLSLLLLSTNAFAQEESAATTTQTVEASAPRPAARRQDNLIGLSYQQWNETMRLQKAGVTDADQANLVGMTLNYEKQISMPRWGFGFGAFLGSGKATGGSNSQTLAYESGTRSWTAYGGYAKIYYKWSGRLFTGLNVPLFMRQLKWQDSATGVSADSGKAFNAGFLLEMNLRLNQKWDLQQALGSTGSDGATLWRLGLAYRL